MPIGFLVALIIAVALQVVSYLLAPKPKQPKPEAAKDLQSPTCSAGQPIIKAWGTITIKQPNVLWAGDKSSNTYNGERVIITVTDMRKAGYCVSGIRRWCQQHDISFADVIANGIPADELIAKGDEHAQRVVDSKLEREAGRG